MKTCKTVKTIQAALAACLLPAVMLPMLLCCQAAQARVIDLQDGSITTIEEFRSRPDRVTQKSQADAMLESAVRQALQREKSVSVIAENGVVTLRGKVESAAERLALVKLTESVEGVKAVRAELRVKGEYDEAEEIRTRSRQLGLDLF